MCSSANTAVFKTRYKNVIEEAYDVAARARALYDDGALVGRKIGFANRGIWNIYGVDRPIWGGYAFIFSTFL